MGELKHGTIALIEKGTSVIAIVSQDQLRSLSAETNKIVIDDVHPLLIPLVTVLPTQLISYYAALQRDFDIDKPRNLEKTVTVE